ncbi:uncharacterized protein LOC126994908 [Eriocheir sinensis]|uniref:uncharacterized protein LOC126994908 n=1 Tax=Eriocheir sinensis TaxID=95602 RepID=UPI0021CA2F9D|nr:uncharacterized protein LOC126994908 [Eriocheir sinensis]
MADNYRQDFHHARIRVGKSYQQFFIHLTQLFQAWLEAYDVLCTFEALREFMLLDQFLTNLTPDLRIFIKERRPKDLPDAVRLADNWSSACNAYPKASSPSSRDPSKAASPTKSSEPSQGTTTKTSAQPSTATVKCHQCGEEGHVCPRCPKNTRAFKDVEPAKPSYQVGFCLRDKSVPKFSIWGTVNGSWNSNIIRDTGCSCVIVSEDLLPDVDVESCPKASLADYLGWVDKFPMVRCHFSCPYFTGCTEVVRAPIKFVGALIGNVPGVRNPHDPDSSQSPSNSSSSSSSSKLQRGISTPCVLTSPAAIRVHAATTCAGRLKRLHPLVLPEPLPPSVTPQDFAQLQASCASLAAIRQKAASGQVDRARNESSFKYLYLHRLLYKKCLTSQLSNKNHFPKSPSTSLDPCLHQLWKDLFSAPFP